MLSLGPGELVLVSVALILVFTSGRLGAFGDALGRLAGTKPKPPSGDAKK